MALFDEVVRSGLLVRGLLALIIIITLSAMVVTQVDVPTWYQNIGLLIVGYFFGADFSQMRAIATQTVRNGKGV